jgi:hypothetical protein
MNNWIRHAAGRGVAETVPGQPPEHRAVNDNIRHAAGRGPDTKEQTDAQPK